MKDSLGRASVVRSVAGAIVAGSVLLGFASCAEIAGIEEAKPRAGSGGSAGSTGSNSGGSPSSGGKTSGESCNDDSVTSCPSSTSMTYCNTDTGLFETAPCSLICDQLGAESGPCVGDYCECGDVWDTFCVDATRLYCNCNGGCSEDEAAEGYVACHLANTDAGSLISCWGDATDCESGGEMCGYL